MSIDPAVAALLLALAVTAHDIEEMVWLPGFRHPPALRLDVPAGAFRIAAVAIAVIFWAAALALVAGWPVGAVLAGFAAAMVVNALVPHLALTVALRRYHPGTATALLLVVPAAVALLAAVDAPARLAGAAAGLAGLAAALPLCLALGRRIERHRRRRS
jgi:hypothetical protein